MTGSPDAAPTPAKRITAPTKIEVGAKVRVVIEASVVGFGPITESLGHKFLTLRYGADFGARDVVIPATYSETVSVEVLTPPAPTYEAGDVILAADGSLYTRRNPADEQTRTFPWIDGGWLIDGWADAEWIKDADIPQPVTLLVRAGKAVQP